MQFFWQRIAIIPCATYAAQLARRLYDFMRKEAASIRIQKHERAHAARKSYTKLKAAVIVIQTGMRAMEARNDYRQRRRNKAATTIQVKKSHILFEYNCDHMPSYCKKAPHS